MLDMPVERSVWHGHGAMEGWGELTPQKKCLTNSTICCSPIAESPEYMLLKGRELPSESNIGMFPAESMAFASGRLSDTCI